MSLGVLNRSKILFNSPRKISYVTLTGTIQSFPMKQVNRLILWVILGIGFLITVIIVYQGLSSVKVTCLNQPDCQSISPYGSFSLEFSRAVIREKVEQNFSTEPDIAGLWLWTDNRHAQWFAQSPLKIGELLTLQLNKSVLGKNDEKLVASFEWNCIVRSPEILFLSSGDAPELFRMAPSKSSDQRQLTQSGGKIYDFLSSPDGEKIVYSVINDQNGADLWMMNREGEAQQLLVNCGKDRCIPTSWSLLTGDLAYTREQVLDISRDSLSTPRPWILNLNNGLSQPLYSNEQIYGYNPNLSPDGRWVSIWSITSNNLEVIDRQSGIIYIISSASGDNGTWSHQGHSLYYEEIVQEARTFRAIILRADLDTQEISVIKDGNLDATGYSYSNPLWNPINNSLVVTMQPNTKLPGGEVLLLSQDGKRPHVLFNDLSKIASYFSWSTDGQVLLFKIFDLSNKDDQGTLILCPINGACQKIEISKPVNRPRWLP